MSFQHFFGFTGLILIHLHTPNGYLELILNIVSRHYCFVCFVSCDVFFCLDTTLYKVPLQDINHPGKNLLFESFNKNKMTCELFWS